MHRTIPIAALPLVVLAGCSHQEEEESAPQAIDVVTAPVRAASMEKIARAVGTVSTLPDRLVQVTAQVEGPVAEVLVSEGDAVKAGQPLVRLDDRLAARSLAERKADRALLAASLVLLKTLPREPERRAADLEVDRARVALDIAREALARLEPLLARQEVSPAQHYEAKQRAEEADLALKAAQARREILMMGPRPEATAEAEAKIAAADEAVRTAEVRLGLLALTAPRAGVVDRILCRVGQMLAAGAVAAEVVDPSEVLVIAPVAPAEAAAVEAGQAARVRPGTRGSPPALSGKVASVGVSAVPSTGSVPVRVRVPDPAGNLRPGTVVSVEVVLGTVPRALAVPEAALVPSEEGEAIVVVRDGKAAVLHPTIGIREGGLVEVSAPDLKEGEPVIVEGGYNLPAGTQVAARKVAKDGKAERAGKDEKAEDEGTGGKAEKPAGASGEGASR